MLKFESQKHLLNYDGMDEIHKEFVDIYNSVDINSLQNFVNKLTELLEHTKKHFSYEEDLMDEYNYPTSKEHKEEHQKVLYEIEYFIKNAQTPFGKRMLKSYYLEKLPDWFDLHLISMDSDLAAFLKKDKVWVS